MSEENKEVHEGVKLLLARMESHPEEFNGVGVKDMLHDTAYNSRWTGVLHRYWGVLTEYEQAMINVSLREANRKNFHSAVMKTILGPDDETTKWQNMEAQRTIGLYPQQMELPGMSTKIGGTYALGSVSGDSLTAYNTIK